MMQSSQAIRHERLLVRSFAELMEHEREVLRRIEATHHGANLFMAHPFMLFEDIGVDLSCEAREELIRREPALTGLSPTVYRALKGSAHPQHVTYRLRGLFRKEERP